jgi:hypothetical protein
MDAPMIGGHSTSWRRRWDDGESEFQYRLELTDDSQIVQYRKKQTKVLLFRYGRFRFLFVEKAGESSPFLRRKMRGRGICSREKRLTRRFASPFFVKGSLFC